MGQKSPFGYHKFAKEFDVVVTHWTAGFGQRAKFLREILCKINGPERLCSSL